MLKPGKSSSWLRMRFCRTLKTDLRHAAPVVDTDLEVYLVAAKGVDAIGRDVGVVRSVWIAWVSAVFEDYFVAVELV